MDGRSRTLSKPTIPYIVSRYLGHTVYLDELAGLTDRELGLLETEVHGLHSECSQTLSNRLTHTGELGTVEKLLRTSGRFSHAIEREMSTRQRKVSILDVLDQLKAVTAERDALRSQVDHLLEQSVR